mgnify:CR=1 FL=1
MIIVSQDEKTIVNFDNVIYANVRKLPPNEIGYAIKIYTFESNFERFALYDTEERAKEVLAEIYKKYSDWQTMGMIKDIYLQKKVIAGDKSEYFNVYLMPEK